MPKIINFQSELGPFSIQLLDNLFVEQWLEHFLKMINRYEISGRPTGWPSIHNNTEVAVNCINDLLESINLANSLEYISPLPEIITKDQLTPLNLDTQQVLNRLHRYAVCAANTRNRWISNQEPTFEWVSYELEQFDYVVNLINQNIHKLEMHVRTPHKEKFNRVYKATEFILNASKYDNVTVYENDVDVMIDDNMFDYLRLSGYDVWIKKDLLGKDFITGFADHDDPNELDIRPPTMYSGAIQIDKNFGKNTIYESPEFISWLGQHPTDFHGNYPLGNVISNKQNTFAKNIQFIGIDNIP